MFQNPKIVLSPTYAYLQQEIRKIPAGDYRILETYNPQIQMFDGF